MVFYLPTNMQALFFMFLSLGTLAFYAIQRASQAETSNESGRISSFPCGVLQKYY